MERTQQLQGKQISGAILRASGFSRSWHSPSETCSTGSGLYPQHHTLQPEETAGAELGEAYPGHVPHDTLHSGPAASFVPA